MLSRIISSRRPGRKDGYIAAATTLTEKENDGSNVDDVFLSANELDDMDRSHQLPPRYRFRDLLGLDFSFNDDGQR